MAKGGFDACLAWDMIRRQILRERDIPGGANIGRLDLTVRHDLESLHRLYARPFDAVGSARASSRSRSRGVAASHCVREASPFTHLG